MLKIDGVDMPSPTTYKIVYNDLDSDNTRRNEQGVMVRDRVRGGVRTISLKWVALSEKEAYRILHATAPQSVQIECIDPAAPSGKCSGKMYTAPRSAEAVNTMDGLRWNISFDEIEF